MTPPVGDRAPPSGVANAIRWLVSAIAVYTVASAGLYLGSAGDVPYVAAGLALLASLLGTVSILALVAPSPESRRYLLAISTVPLLTISRLVAGGILRSVTLGIFLCVLLATTLLCYSRAVGPSRNPLRARRGDVLSALFFGLPLGGLLALSILIVFPERGPGPWIDYLPLASVAGLVALLDESWLRDVVHRQVAAASLPWIGWLACVVFFAESAAFSGDLLGLGVRAGLSALLGLFVWHGRSIALAVASRFSFAFTVVLLAPVVFNGAIVA